MGEIQKIPDISYNSLRLDIIDLIEPKDKKILDIGCAMGKTSFELKKRGAAFVAGIELSEKVGSEASKLLDKVIIGDIEKIDPPFEKEYFDYIIYGDVLEHLTDPWEILTKCAKYLKKDGFVIASIPNIRHYSVINDLVFKGKWPYVEEGIICKSHLRFFTLDEIKKLFAESNYKIVELRRNLSATKTIGNINRVFRYIFTEFLTRLYLIKARKI